MGRRYSGDSDIYTLCRSSRSPLASPSKVPIYEDDDETPLLVSKLSSEPNTELDIYDGRIIVEKRSRHSFIHVIDKENDKLISSQTSLSSNDSPKIQDSILSIKISKPFLSEEDDEVIKALVFQSKKRKGVPRKMNLYEAFGVTSKLRNAFFEQPIFVVEILHSGVVKCFQVPHKYSLKTKWVLYGRHIYVYMGHSFVEFKSSPNLMSLFMCISSKFRAYQDYFRCLDCNFTCLHIGEETINPCPLSRILTEEMNFPYD